MDEIIAQATTLINETLKTLSRSSSDSQKSEKYNKLLNIPQLLNQLRESSSSKNDWIRLFCRRLKRLMNYNKTFPDEFWVQLHDDIIYVLQTPNYEQNKDSDWTSVREKLELESKLDHRELQFQKTVGERKSLDKLFSEHEVFLKEYLQKCISLHSKVQTRGLVENVDDLLYRVFGFTKDLFTSDSRKNIEKKLKCIEIPFDCSKRTLKSLDSAFFISDDKSSKIVNNSLSNFLPSVQRQQSCEGRLVEIENALQTKPWLVILGDPGTAKTTLLRWFMHVFAEAVLRHIEDSVLEENTHSAVRIPILIRIGEFATWRKQSQNKKLIDYIGKHTWFSQSYTHDDNGNILRELIYHNRTLILLDGLDEIPDIGQRQEIVDLVKEFIDEYVRTSDFFSVFDYTTLYNLETLSSIHRIVEMSPLSENDGNQIVITSRIVGYHLCPLTSSLIQHSLVLPIKRFQADQFVDEWMKSIEKGIYEVLSEEIKEMSKVVQDLSEKIHSVMEKLTKKIHDVMEAIFKNNSNLSISTYSLLSLICTSVFHSSDDFSPKSPIEVYHHAVQSALHSWENEESSISKSVLTNFLINLATYLHLQSPSGLIDEFDMEHLCCLTLKQQGISNDRAELRKYAKTLISLLDSNVGIVAERGLQVFGFLHLSFQEYFVSQFLIKGSCINEVSERILSLTINPRFRESLLLAVGWISWKCSYDDYDKFCKILITPTNDYAIQFGIFFFFDALNDIQRLPSNSMIFTAINNLLDHPYHVFFSKFFILYLFKLHQNIIMEWMQTRLHDIKSLVKFCQCLLTKIHKMNGVILINEISIPSFICEQLWLLRNINTTAELVVDQTLRNILTAENAPINTISKALSSNFRLYKISVSKIHSLILSVIIAVYSGVHLESIGKISFSPEQSHRESSILSPIIKYFSNNKVSHQIKVQTLIKEFEEILEKSKQENNSLDIIDSLVALICLQGISQPSIYQKYTKYQELPLVLHRLKRTWFYLRESFTDLRRNLSYNDRISFNKTEIEPILKMLFSKTTRSDETRIVFSLACAAACEKLGIMTSEWLSFEVFRNNNVNQYLERQPEFESSLYKHRWYQAEKNIYLLKMFPKELFFLLTFIPQSLQPLYYWMINNSTDNIDSLPKLVLFSQYLMWLAEADFNKYDKQDNIVLLNLQSMFKENMLENYGLVLYWKNKYINEIKDISVKEFLKAMQNDILCDQSLIERPKDWKIFINVELQRINKAKNLIQNHEKDLRLFAASISLARLFQAQYHLYKYHEADNISLSSVDSDKVHSTLLSITNPVLRIIALCMILDMKDPLIFDEEQRDKLRREMIIQLQSLLPDLPLLTSTLLFVRCHSVCQVFSELFQQMANVIGKKLNEITSEQQIQYKEAAFIALRQLNNSDLSSYLLEFEK